MQGYNTRDVAKLLDMQETQIRDLAHTGLVQPTHRKGEHYRFSFQDIVLLRTARDLIHAGVRPTKLSRILLKLRSGLPERKSLTSLRILNFGEEVVIQDESELYNAESGQIELDLVTSQLAGQVAELSAQARIELTSELATPEDWFDLGVDLEDVQPDEAPAAYLKALELDPAYSDAYVNLGRLAQESGDVELAEHYYRQAIDAEDDNLLASYNLGTLLEDLGRIDDAISAYQLSLPFAAAHYNLARLFGITGNVAKADEHMRQYEALTDELI